MRLDIYVHIEFNLIPMIVTCVFIINKIFLFVMSNELWNIETKLHFDTEFSEKLNQLFQTYKSNYLLLIYLVLFLLKILS